MIMKARSRSCDHLSGERVVAIDQGAHRLGDRLLDHAAHADDARLQLGKLVIEKGPGGGHDARSYPNRPVM